MLNKSLFAIYFSRDMESLDTIRSELAAAIQLHWQGKLDKAADEYATLLKNRTFSVGTAEYDLVVADKALVEVKIGKPFAEQFDFARLASPSAKLIAHYARFYWGFWSNHDVARDSIRKMLPLSLRSECKDFFFALVFMYGHVSIIRTGKRSGYYIATTIHKLMFHLVKRNKWIKDFSRNIVFASYPYTQFISGRISGAEIEKTIEIGETLVAKEDPYYQCLLLISGLYGYAYSGNIAKTEIFCQRFQVLHTRGKLLRYAPVSEVMRLLPFALRGYGHLVEEEYLALLKKFTNHDSDALIKSQFYRACSVISLILGNNFRALEFIEVARRERIKTRSFIAWEKFDLNIKRLSQRSIPFDLTKDRLLNVELNYQSPPQLGPILFKLLELTPKALEVGEDWLEDQIKALICSHIGIENARGSRDASVAGSSNPAILVGKLLVEFPGIPETQTPYIREILNSLSAVVNSYLKTYRKLIEAQKLERDAAIVGLASETAHNILASLDALDFDLTDSLQDKEEQRIRRRNLINRMKAVANGLLQRKKQINENSRRNDGVQTTVELMSGLVDNIVTEKRVKYANTRSVEILWELSPISYSFFAKVDAPEFEVTVGNIIDNAVEAIALIGSRPGKVVVDIERLKASVNIIISDNGCGIPQNILSEICTKKKSYGKLNGNGYGLFHANKTVAALGGTLKVDSEEGTGTTVTVSIPLADSPNWFVRGLDLSKTKNIIILDDDFGAHTIWDSRFQSSSTSHIKIHHFYSGKEFERFFEEHGSGLDEPLFLFDFELVGPDERSRQQSKDTGLSLIRRYDLKNAYIVSSYYRDLDVLADCQKTNIKIVPKNFIRFVPVNLSAKSERSSVLIDDHSSNHEMWSKRAKDRNSNLFTYFSVDDFLADAQSYGLGTKIYVDSVLGNDRKGEIESKKIAAIGFEEIYLTSGFPESHFSDVSHIKQILPKLPPMNL